MPLPHIMVLTSLSLDETTLLGQPLLPGRGSMKVR
jgi:hypothetical protein